jgi:hypothetical protein
MYSNTTKVAPEGLSLADGLRAFKEARASAAGDRVFRSSTGLVCFATDPDDGLVVGAEAASRSSIPSDEPSTIIESWPALVGILGAIGSLTVRDGGRIVPGFGPSYGFDSAT